MRLYCPINPFNSDGSELSNDIELLGQIIDSYNGSEIGSRKLMLCKIDLNYLIKRITVKHFPGPLIESKYAESSHSFAHIPPIFYSNAPNVVLALRAISNPRVFY